MGRLSKRTRGDARRTFRSALLSLSGIKVPCLRPSGPGAMLRTSIQEETYDPRSPATHSFVHCLAGPSCRDSRHHPCGGRPFSFCGLLRMSGERHEYLRLAGAACRQQGIRPGGKRAAGGRRRQRPNADPLLGHEPVLRGLLPHARAGGAARRPTRPVGDQLRADAPHGQLLDLGVRARTNW